MATLIAQPPEAEFETPLNSSDRPEPNASGKTNGRAHQFAQILVLLVLFAAPALMVIHQARVGDQDLWWHLRAGEWILQHGRVPRVDIFSNSIAGKPWADYSWMFETLVAKLFQRLGMEGTIVYTAGMVIAITVALFNMVRRRQKDFSCAILLAFVAGFSMQPVFTPRPWLFTVLLFILVMDIVMEVRATGRLRELLWLPPIFALWANLHIQFVCGLAVIALALCEGVIRRWWNDVESRAPVGWMAAALIASIAATLLNPYGWHIYGVLRDIVTQPGGMDKITELQAMPFRVLSNWGVLGLTIAAVAMLARKSRLLPFESALLAFAVYVSFRSQRDQWMVVVVGCSILASHFTAKRRNPILIPRFVLPLVAIASTLVLPLGFRLLRIDNARLSGLLAESMPVHAAEFVKAQGYTGRIYNDFNWGGYLMWALQKPVSIDGRGTLYGDAGIDRSVATWSAEPDWKADPALTSAGVIIGPAKAPLTQILRLDPHFQLVFEDKLAAIFVPRR